MTFEQATNHSECPEEIKNTLRLIDVKYFDFHGNTEDGQIVVHQNLVKDVEDLFHLMLELKFPLQEVSPIVKFDWDDEASMSVNNTSAFNFRKIAGQDKMSLHSYGMAIDLNPKINPWVKGEQTQPANGSYNIDEPGTLFAGHPVVEFMQSRGWEWGGDWENYQDYQHFQKDLR